MPVFENIAFDKDIYANNTCGLNGPGEYCVQTGTSGAKKICDLCDNTRKVGFGRNPSLGVGHFFVAQNLRLGSFPSSGVWASGVILFL